MRKIINKAVLIAAISLMSPGVALAEDDEKDQFNPVYTAVTSQSIAADARAAGMGDMGAATDPDVNSQSWNPAKYPFTISRAGVSLNYTPCSASSSTTLPCSTPPATCALVTIRPSVVRCAISRLATSLPAP